MYEMERTSKPEYIPYIISALKKGPKKTEVLLKEIHRQMEPHLKKGDHTILPNGEPRWRNQAIHMIDGLLDDGHIIQNGELRLRDS